MTDTGSQARLRRLKYWIAWLTIIPGVVLAVVGLWKAVAGYFIGGLIVFLNLLVTQWSVLAFVDGSRRRRVLAAALYVVKLAVMAAVIAAVIIAEVVSPITLVLGITTLFVALLFDFLFFPRNIEE